jgi:hypothetical protein
MRIDSLSLDLSSQHYLEQTHSTQQRVTFWQEGARQNSPQDQVEISEEGRRAAAAQPGGSLGDISQRLAESNASQASSSVAASDNPLETDLSPTLSLLRNILESTFGIRIDLSDVYPLDKQHLQAAAQDQAMQGDQQQQGEQRRNEGNEDWGLRIEREMHYSEQESLQFSASGNITTRDGRSLSFQLEVSLQRSFAISSKETLNFGAAARDPLMISLGSDAGTLSGATVQFDIDNDGQKNTLPVPKNGGWLALDRNGNGKIDQQNELFGPQSGNGFGELAALDSDGNGAIDEGDPLFARLQLWQGQQGGQDQLSSLMDVGIGALLLPHVDAEFRHTDAANQTVAQMRKAGVYLTEGGQAGLISQLDLTA